MLEKYVLKIKKYGKNYPINMEKNLFINSI